MSSNLLDLETVAIDRSFHFAGAGFFWARGNNVLLGGDFVLEMGGFGVVVAGGVFFVQEKTRMVVACGFWCFWLVARCGWLGRRVLG